MKTLVKPRYKSLQKRMASDKVIFKERVWEIDPVSKRGKWVNKQETGTLKGYNPETKNYEIQLADGSIVQRANFSYYKKPSVKRQKQIAREHLIKIYTKR